MNSGPPPIPNKKSDKTKMGSSSPPPVPSKKSETVNTSSSIPPPFTKSNSIESKQEQFKNEGGHKDNYQKPAESPKKNKSAFVKAKNVGANNKGKVVFGLIIIVVGIVLLVNMSGGNNEYPGLIRQEFEDPLADDNEDEEEYSETPTVTENSETYDQTSNSESYRDESNENQSLDEIGLGGAILSSHETCKNCGDEIDRFGGYDENCNAVQFGRADFCDPKCCHKYNGY
jgi:hypothetical protein